MSKLISFTMAPERYNLTWQGFDNCVSNAFKELLDNEDFVDVTLVSDDGHKIKCHRVVISAGSPVLKSILENHPHPHPLIFLSGMKYPELRALVTFLYIGQTEVAQDDLNMFMSAAAKLQVKALSNCQINEEPKTKKHLPDDNKTGNEVVFSENKQLVSSEQNTVVSPEQKALKSEPVDAEQDFPKQADDVKLKNEAACEDDAPLAYDKTNSINSSKAVLKHKCEYCDYRSRFRRNIDLHSAAQHEGKRYPCDVCSYEAKYFQDLTKHKTRKHSSPHEGKRYPCNVCNYEAKYHLDLTTHKNRKHS